MAIKKFNTADFTNPIYASRTKSMAVEVDGHRWIFRTPGAGTSAEISRLYSEMRSVEKEGARLDEDADAERLTEIKLETWMLSSRLCEMVSRCFDDKGDGSIQKWIDDTPPTTVLAMYSAMIGSMKEKAE